MTTSTWDSQDIRTRFSECPTLREIIEKIESEFAERGEVVCEIRVDGQVMDEGDEARFAALERETIREISIVSDRPAELIVKALDSTLVFLSELEHSSVRASVGLRGAEFQTAQKAVQECLDGCMWFIGTLEHIRGAASGIGRPLANDERWMRAQRAITQVIRDLSEAYENKDYVLAADLMEYELTGAVALWREALAMERDRRAA